MKNKIPYVIEKEFNKYEEVLDFIKLRLEKKDNLPTTYFSFHILTDEGEFVVTQGEAEIFFDFNKENNIERKLYLVKFRRYISRQEDNSLIDFNKY